MPQNDSDETTLKGWTGVARHARRDPFRPRQLQQTINHHHLRSEQQRHEMSLCLSLLHGGTYKPLTASQRPATRLVCRAGTFCRSRTMATCNSPALRRCHRLQETVMRARKPSQQRHNSDWRVKESRSPESHHAIVAPRTGPSQSKTIKPSWCASASSQANGHLALLASNRNLRRHINDVPSASPAKRVASPCA